MPPGKDLGPETMERTWARVPNPLWTDRKTPVKTLPSRRTTCAGGNSVGEYLDENVLNFLAKTCRTEDQNFL